MGKHLASRARGSEPPRLGVPASGAPGRSIVTGFPARLERFSAVDSTQRVVSAWLDAGAPEVAVAVADVQTAGRGRHGRSWEARSGSGLLLSCGFRPVWLAPRHGWRLSAIVALSMLDAAEEIGGLPDGTLGLKWPNDLVATPQPEGSEAADPGFRKLAGVLAETSGYGDSLATAIVGIGVNVTWPSAAFPPGLRRTMTSLSELTGGRPIERDALLDAFLARLAVRYEALAGGRFDAGGWSARQRTTGRELEVALDRTRRTGTGAGVDPDSGALLLETADGVVAVNAGDVMRCRLNV
jgi:BirA family biotin operon repressor/biotin-[acetyl-CoA-carboxylase] ligase